MIEIKIKFSSGGKCNKMSHQTECCHSKFVPNYDQCGWIYDTYGVKITCPKGDYIIIYKTNC